jgi:hypothetical protein
LPTGTILATNDDRTTLIRTDLRTLLEREGRSRAETVSIRGGAVYVDDGSEADADLDQPTGEDLAREAFDEPYVLDNEPPIGLDPHPFDITEFEPMPEAKLELVDGVIYGDYQLRATMLRALLANAGLREVVKLAPRQLWLHALG